MNISESSGFLDRPDGEQISWRRVPGRFPTVVWLGGYGSDMTGTKAQALADAAAERGWSFLRFDYFAHGTSSGEWDQATIGRWREDVLAVLDDLTQEQLVLVGSSMGGWMACLAALARPDRIKALVLVAPAPDFTEALMKPDLSPQARLELERDGATILPSDYSGGYVLTRRFLEEGRDWNVLDEDKVAIDAPVRILQGKLDPDVPWEHAQRLARALTSKDVEFTLIEDGDHRLSRDQDIEKLIAAVAGVV
jgi:pimeloyl-ACP methyl ester carboxylesterase